MQSTNHKEALTALLDRHRERGEPFAFAGRKDMIDTILRVAKSNHGNPKAGCTYLITGAPGAGKTSLVREFLKEWEERQRGTSVFCESPPNEREDAAYVWDLLASKLTGIPVKDLRKDVQRRSSEAFGLNAGIRGSVTREHSEVFRSSGIWSCRMIKGLVEDESFAAPCILAIDEIQMVGPDSASISLLKDLHTQSQAPVLLVCAGLANSSGNLRKANVLSRVDQKSVIRLGKLELEEAREAVSKGLRVIAQTADVDGDRLVDVFCADIVRESDQWPRHITCYLHGVTEALLAQDAPDLDTLDQQCAMDLGAGERQAYYRERLNASDLPEQMIESLYTLIDRGPLRRDMADGLLGRAILEDESPEGDVLRNRFIDADETAFESTLRSGLITLDEDELCEVPIASMRTYVRDRCASHSK